MRSTFLRALVVAGLLAAIVAVSGQEVSSSTGGIDEFEVSSSSSAGVDVGTNEVFSSSAVGEAPIVVESSSSSSSSSSAEMTVDSSSAAVVVDSSVASSTAAEALTPGVVESSSAAGEAPGNVVESSTAGGVVVPPNSVESSTAAAAGEGTPGNVVESSTAVAGGDSTPTTVESSSAAGQAAPGTPGNAVESSTAVAGGVAPSNSVQSTAVEVVPPQSVESSTAAAGGVTPGNVVESSSTAAALGPFRALDPSVSPDGTIPTTPNGQFYLPADADSSFVVPAGATSITSATFTIVGANGGAPGNLVLFTSSNGGATHTVVGVSENITPCATAGCTKTVGPLTFTDPLNGDAPVEVTGGQIVGLYLTAAVQNSFGYDTTAAGTFRAANFNNVIQAQTLTYVPLAASDFFTPAFNGALLFDVEYGYPTSSSTGGAAANTNVVASSTAVNGASAGAAVSSSSTGGANNVAASSSSSSSLSSSSSSGDVRRLVASSSSSTGPRVVDSSTIPAWVFNISSSGINGGGGCIPGLTCAAPHAASSSVGMIIAAAVVALVAAFAQ